MSKRPWMPFYPNDFRLDTLGLDDGETGVYIILICLAWRQGDGSITGDMGELKKVLQQCFARFHGHSFNRIIPKLLRRYFEQKEDGRWYQKRVVKELQIADKISANQKQKINKRWSDYRKNKALADTAVIPSHSHSQLELSKEESSNPPAAAKYEFEEGRIRLTRRDYDRWQEANPHLDLRSELISIAPWAETQKNWFVAVSLLLARHNREARALADKANGKKRKWRVIDGVEVPGII
jgi:uncharacterized protein YdaU (DUF1376 family)